MDSVGGINWLAPEPLVSDKNKSQNVTDSLPPVSYHVHAFYYAWYNAPSENQSVTDDRHWVHWNHVRLAHHNPRIASEYSTKPHRPPKDIGASFYPQIGPYASKDIHTLKAHFRMATFAGIGVWVLSWYPAGMSDPNGEPVDNLVLPILNMASEYNMKSKANLAALPLRVCFLQTMPLR
ncbi:hypothetical protein AHF37_06584 [Paragonimus kellicotti]|nr:hypothetical protein AHF37_06584 [Paragonimus kellicotti]